MSEPLFPFMSTTADARRRKGVVFDDASWRAFVMGYTIYDCAIVREKGYGFVLVEQKNNRDPLPVTRFINLAADKPMDARFAVYEVGHFGFTTITCGTNPPEYVAVDTGRRVYSASGQRKGVEKDMDEVVDMSVGDATCVIERVVRVAGQVYALGCYRKIYRRVGHDQWVDLASEGHGVPLPADFEKRHYMLVELGFKDMCGFNANDMYAVGGKGDVWHFNGEKWKQCPFPTNTVLETVACGDDGQVYISDQKGCVWAGRENRWKQIADADFNWGHQPTDSAWFKGRLYLGSQECLYVLSDKKLVPLHDLDETSPKTGDCGRVDVSPDGNFMLTAGSQGASLYDGEKWTKLFSSFDFM